MKIRFKKIEDYSEANMLQAMNKKDEALGVIYYNPAWKCHVWQQWKNMIMDHDCLQQIVDKLKELDRRKK